MGHEENARTVERFRQTFKSGDLAGLNAMFNEQLHEDAVQEWPQSGERIRGKKNIMAINENYPGLPSSVERRVLGSGDLWTYELTLNYGGKTVHGCTILEFKDGKIIKLTDYFADPFEAPEWRAKYVEKMEPVSVG